MKKKILIISIILIISLLGVLCFKTKIEDKKKSLINLNKGDTEWVIVDYSINEKNVKAILGLTDEELKNYNESFKGLINKSGSGFKLGANGAIYRSMTNLKGEFQRYKSKLSNTERWIEKDGYIIFQSRIDSENRKGTNIIYTEWEDSEGEIFIKKKDKLYFESIDENTEKVIYTVTFGLIKDLNNTKKDSLYK